VVAVAQQIVTAALSGMVATGDLAATRGVRQVGVRARLGDAGVAELVDSFMAGTTREDLAAQSGISLSSVKRLLRLHGARRFKGSVALADRGRQWSLTALDSDAGGECVEGHPEPVVSWFVGSEFVMVASQVLHEGMPGGQRLS